MAVTYAMMGPLMAIVRPIAAVLSAIGVGVMTGISEENEARSEQDR